LPAVLRAIHTALHHKFGREADTETLGIQCGTKSRIAGKCIKQDCGCRTEVRMIALKRVYEPASPKDGIRILVERLWPRGVKKSSLQLEQWAKEVAPSGTLRKWFHHDPARWQEFKRRYFRELDKNQEIWRPLLAASRKARMTLIYSSHDREHNNAVALKEYLQRKQHSHALGTQEKAAWLESIKQEKWKCPALIEEDASIRRGRMPQVEGRPGIEQGSSRENKTRPEIFV
jgi:uncharacterized protein YeaO (DUF488 family)